LAIYLYGIIDRPAGKRFWGTGVGQPPSRLRLIAFENMAALVSDLQEEETESEGRALRRDLKAHEEVVRRAMEFGTVLPVSFGTAFEDDQQLIQELLEPSADELAELLESFEGLVELTLKVDFVEHQVIHMLLQRDAELRAWRDAASFAGTEEKIAFGQALSEAIEDEGTRVAERVVARLEPLAKNARFHGPPSGTGVLKASFLVDARRLRQFDAAVEALAADSRGLFELDYLGPVPPYSFIKLNLGESVA
jgi:hypothetical protein